MSIRLLTIIFCCLLAYNGRRPTIVSADNAPKKPNILLILTDDQDVALNGMVPMRNVLKLLGNEGAAFINAFTSSPLCCPSRASILTGMYAHNHQTTNNSLSGGCYSSHWRSKIEMKSLAVDLQNGGYQTFFAGKYLNQYHGQSVPPGWDDFHGLHGNSRYYNFTLRENAQNVSYPPETYLTDLLLNLTVKFLDQRSSENDSRPFFAMIAPPAPHAPFTPAERHRGVFADVKAPRTPNFNRESKPLEKHWLVASAHSISDSTLATMDLLFQHRWESLLAVDELLASVVNTLDDLGELENTFVVFTSDNGYHVGQFAQPFDKRQPYETDIRVPLFVRGPGIVQGVEVSAPVSLIDLLPTVLEWARLPQPRTADGQSFNAFLMNAPEYDALRDKSYRRSLLVQHWGEGNDDTYSDECPFRRSDHLAQCSLEADCHCQDAWNNTYACVRHFRYGLDRLYCEFTDHENFVEAYDLGDDPYQMKNVGYELLPIERAFYSLALANLTRCSGSSCNDINI